MLCQNNVIEKKKSACNTNPEVNFTVLLHQDFALLVIFIVRDGIGPLLLG